MNSTDTATIQVVSEKDFFWEIGTAEEKRLSDLLEVDFHSFNIEGTFVRTPKQNCKGCGKLSGLDDFVATALSSGIHSKEFMKRALNDENMAINATPHYLTCAACGTPDPEPKAWSQTQNWRPRRGWNRQSA